MTRPYPGGSSYRRHRRRRPQLVWAGAGLLVILVAGGLIYQHHRNSVAADKRDQRAAEQTVRDWIAAVQTGDGTRASGLAAGESRILAQALITRTPKDLHATKTVVRLTSPVSRKTGATYTETVTLRGLGDVSWTGRIPLQKVTTDTEGKTKGWRVPFTESVLMPALRAGQHLARTRELGTRGKILLDDGTSMALDPVLAGSIRGAVTTLKTDQAAAAIGPLAETGDDAGTSGLQAAFERTLAGTPGGSFAIVDAKGRTVTALKTFPKVDGKDVPTTLDTKVEAAAQAAMDTTGGKVGGMAVLDMRTGALLASADSPLGGFGRALKGTYPPGSTYKIVTSMAALAHGVPASTTLDCAQTISIGGRTFKNAENEQFGALSFQQAFARSCNTWFVQIAQKVSLKDLTAESRLFGFADSQKAATDPLPIASFGGSWPAAQTIAGAAGQSIGQDQVQASPMQMASVAAAIGSGAWHSPHLTPDAKVVTHPLPAGDVVAVRGFMGAVLQGQGTAAGISFPPGTFGKTGTAETSNPDPKKTDSWFVAVDGNYAVACVFDGAGFGADVAAPVVAQFLRTAPPRP